MVSVERQVSNYAPGTQKTRVSGDVLRWNEDSGVEPVDAVSYMESLESQVTALKEKVRGPGCVHFARVVDAVQSTHAVARVVSRCGSCRQPTLGTTPCLTT